MMLRCAGLAAILGIAISAGAAFAQGAAKYEPPRTASGKPDLQGVWSSATATTMERPAGYPLVITREQADAIEGGALFNKRMKTQASYVDPKEGAPEKGKPLPPVGNYDVAYTDPGSSVISIGGELRSSWIVYPENGKIPALTPEGKAIQAASPQRVGSGYDNPEERGAGERCIVGFGGTGGPPMMNVLYNNNYQIIQAKDHVVIVVEMNHDARIIPLNAKHRPTALNPYLGDSIGWWEGDTLVVETVNINPNGGGQVQLSPNGKIIEKFTRYSDTQVLYEFEVHDPTIYSQVWKGEVGLNQVKDHVYEYACHEGNYGLHGILEGGRAADRGGKNIQEKGDRDEG